MVKISDGFWYLPGGSVCRGGEIQGPPKPFQYYRGKVWKK
jgi:8-oxo-dGTP pyrophosphatase MutT (NUDIX family)